MVDEEERPSLTFHFLFVFILVLVVFYIRYRQIGMHFEGSGRTTLLKLNTATFVMGITAAFGISIVGNFQVS
jgi:hypothetical protein